MTAAADDAFSEPKSRLPWYEFRTAQLEQNEAVLEALFQKASVSQVDVVQTRLERAKAELALIKLKKRMTK